MATFHIIDPLLKGEAGHYLTQHIALWSLCRSRSYEMVSYVHNKFDETLMPQEVKVEKIFGTSLIPEINGHYTLEMGLSNARCYEDLSKLDISRFKKDDIIFMTSANSDRVVAYGKWLREVSHILDCKIGLYAIVSSEVDDTWGRAIRRAGIPINDDSFSSLDQMVAPNEVKRSMYRYLFDSIPREKIDLYRVFYEEPFPNRYFLSLSQDPRLRFIHLHSMYPESSVRHDDGMSGDSIHIVYLGSGGVGDMDKGQGMLPGLVKNLSAYQNIHFSIQIGSGSANNQNSEMYNEIAQSLDNSPKVRLINGVLECNRYYSLLEEADIVILPYGPRYRHWMSGIFDECLYLGKVCVIPSDSKMGLWMEHHNLDCPSFDTWDISAITNAVHDAITNYPLYRDNYRMASEICRTHWARSNPIDAFKP